MTAFHLLQRWAIVQHSAARTLVYLSFLGQLKCGAVRNVGRLRKGLQKADATLPTSWVFGEKGTLCMPGCCIRQLHRP